MAKEFNCNEREDMEDEFQLEPKTVEEIWEVKMNLPISCGICYAGKTSNR